MAKKVKDKLYVVRKYIYAQSAQAALKIERKTIPDDVYLDSDWAKNNSNELVSAIGFHINNYEDEE